MRIFPKDSHFTFQMRNGEWITGIITKVDKDSFSFTQEIIRYYPIGTDTLHFSGFRFSTGDVKAIPSRRQSFVYDGNRVRVTLGREKFVWIRNGLIFQIAGAGYLGLNVINDLAGSNPPFAKKNLPELGLSAFTFLIGTFLQMMFDPLIYPGKKYRLEVVSF